MKALFATTALSAVLLAACGQPAAEPEVEIEDAAQAAAETPTEAAPEAEPEVAPIETAEAELEGDALDAVLADPRRDADRARDEFRNPGETLRFFEVEPGHTVVEALPGGGW